MVVVKYRTTIPGLEPVRDQAIGSNPRNNKLLPVLKAVQVPGVPSVPSGYYQGGSDKGSKIL